MVATGEHGKLAKEILDKFYHSFLEHNSHLHIDFILFTIGSKREHLSVLEFKREKCKEEMAELEQTIERVQQQQSFVQAVKQIEAKSLSLSSNVAIEREDYQTLVTASQKYVVQEKQESKLKKLLKDAKKIIANLKAKIESLVAELSVVKEELIQYKSVCGQLRTADLK